MKESNLKTFISKNKAWVVISSVIIVIGVLALVLHAAGIFAADVPVVTSPSDVKSVTFSLKIALDDGTVLFDDDVRISEGVSLLAAMEEALKEHGGIVSTESTYGSFITSVCGHSEDAAASKYWVYYINGESVMESASAYIPQNGDKALFELTEFGN